MSFRNLSPSVGKRSNTYEIHSYNTNPENDLIIAKWKAAIFEKEQSIKDYNFLQSKIRNLQNDLQLLSEEKLRLEYEFHNEIDSGNKAIANLRKENENISQELNEKILGNKKLYNDNDTLFQSWEEQTNENTDLRNQIQDQENILSKINQEKSSKQHQMAKLSQTRERDMNDIDNLQNEISKFWLLSQSKDSELKSLKHKNKECLKEVEHVSTENKKLVSEWNSNDETWALKEQQLGIAKETIVKLESEFDSLNIEYNKNKSDFAMMIKNSNKGKQIWDQIERNNYQLEGLIKERNEEIISVGKENDTMKSNLNRLNTEKDIIGNEIEAFKRHLKVLIKQNNILSNELITVIEGDNKMKMQWTRSDKLVIATGNNRTVVNNSLNNLKEYLDTYEGKIKQCGMNSETQMMSQNSTFGVSGQVA